MVLLAILINVLLIAVVAWGLQTSREPIQDITADAFDRALGPASATSDSSAAPGVTAAAARTACPLNPLLAAAGAQDGRVTPPASVDGKTVKDIDALLLAGKQATDAGRLRDAEVDYLTSCRVADALKGAGSMESAQARYQLARHYAAVANSQRSLPVARRAVILARAQAYYEDSLRRFQAAGDSANEPARLAAEGLKTTRMALAQTAAQPVAKAEPEPQAATTAQTPPQAAATARMGAGPAPPQVQGKDTPKAKPPRTAARARTSHRAAAAKPSFDCRKARSYSERTICSDSHLARLDRETGRLHAKARKAARDPAAFKRQNDAEWRRREQTCHDRACLLRWYAQRQQQLTHILARSATPAARTASR
jgi:hypothetical protein